MRSVAVSLVAMLALSACGSEGTPPGNNTADTGVAPGDTGTAAGQDSGPVSAYPPPPYGTSIGRVFRPFTLQGCANHEGDWNFATTNFADSRVTLVLLSAGWCVPCQRETAQLEAQINSRYRDMGVRVVQVLVQGPTTSSPITASFCAQWATRYGISNPVLMDPRAITSEYAPMQAYPSNLVVDGRGRIRWRHYGSETGLAEMRAQIDEVLAHPEPL